MAGRSVRWHFTDRVPPARASSFDAGEAPFTLASPVGEDSRAAAVNREVLRLALGLTTTPIFMQQVHGAGVAVISDPPLPGAPDVPGVDALVTTRPDVALAVLVADCVPLLLFEPAGDVVAAVHAGREGVRAGVVDAVLSVIEGLGARPQSIRAVLGPAIGGCCYEVPQQLREGIAAVVPSARATTRWGTPALDLPAAVTAQLRAGGVAQVRVDGRCTYESARHFSYRREGRTGRCAGVVVIRGNA